MTDPADLAHMHTWQTSQSCSYARMAALLDLSRAGDDQRHHDCPRAHLVWCADHGHPHLLCGSSDASFNRPRAHIVWVAYHSHPLAHLPISV
jgi:hypothetical protein